ncbi:mitochondrial inner-membrane-bound regulator-domain-containing protein [Alternaria rosae]|uniref:mitochondrial inner-membrane-bound regulator-domain-containing protein n=1 Tax=Alternaria rosae TaxID=1187941 RepID=UPI001E8EA7F9|nr:mitochondrial inner-membrane-bound regulator-domain-containing protein [Alternaria rosae]KAH6875659.1 mitochondrial inner-membrane-bound regulator-domain-containing protein [Alternaria rosae]
MLAPRTSSAFVCLRCEAQIARRRLHAFPRPPSRANFSASARRRDDAEDEQRPTLKITKQVTPINRLRKRKGHKILRETSQNLGVKRLGDDADILVLREVGETAQREPTTTTEASEDAEVVEISEPLEVPDIVASLEEEGKTLAPEEIYKQIETLRPNNNGDPNEPHYVKQTTFVKLRKTLLKGFTQQQLTIFYAVAKNIRQEKVNQGVIDSIKRKDKSGDQKRSVERSEWQPGTTPITQRLPGVDRHVKITGYRKNVSKQLLVDRIMRDVWNLVLLEEIESPGELELSLQPWQSMLLKAGDKDTLFDKIRRTRRVRLDMYKPHHALRITSDKTTAEYAANDIEEAFQHTEMKRMNLNNYLRQLANGPVALNSKSNLVTLFYTQKDFDVVSALTRTSIEAVGKTMLVIRGFDVSSIEEAKRTLIRFLPFKDSAERTFDTQKLGHAESTAFLSPVLTEHDSLEYKYRKRELGRLSMPIMRLTEPESAETKAEKPAKVPKTTLHGLVNRTLGTILRPASAVSLPQHELSNWIPEPVFDVSAEFGQVLFPLEDMDPSRVVEAALSETSKSPFVSTFPGLNSVFTSPNISVISRLQTPSLHYQFRPDLEHEPGQVFPNLRIQMRTGRSGAKATLRKLALSFDQRIHDVLLPDKAVDIRFQRRANLSFNVKDHNDENVQAWVDAVTENIESGGRLTAPPLRIKIPKWTIPGFSSEEKGMRTVTYHFSGIQFRQPVIGDLFGVAISYNTVQSGKLGAKGGALTAHYSGHGDTELRDESAMKAFVERCFDMADLITDASKQTLPASRIIRPRDMNSERKAKRMELSGERPQAMDEQSIEPANDLVERVGEYPDIKGDIEAKENAEAADDVVEEQPVEGEMESRSDDSVAESDNVRTL